MMQTNRKERSGLILLVVLGMLSLFSLLAVSYVVVSSQSRVSSLGRARVDFRGTPPDRLLNDAVNLVLRGSSDPNASIYHHDLLGDLYGNSEQPLRLRVRRTQFGLPTIPATGNYPPLSHGQIERPMLLANRFLRIPIVLARFNANNERPLRDTVLQGSDLFNPLEDLPQHDDAWAGRVVTFLQGPLRGQSFRVVHYIGDPRLTNPGANPVQLAQNFSIVIDLQDASGSSINVGTTTLSIQDWINQTPLGGNDLEKRGLFLCYPQVPQNNQGGTRFTTGYELLLNAAPLNGFGFGITGNRLGQTQSHNLGPAYSSADPDIVQMPAALQPHFNLLGQNGGQLDDGQGNAFTGLLGDSDEDYDAADYQNMWLSHRQQGATQSEQIIPSFHRAALINYIVNFKDPATYTPDDFRAVIERIRRATLRPLSIRVQGLPVPLTNVGFTGGNAGDYGAAGDTTDDRIPQLDVNWNNWTNAGATDGVTAFLRWVRWLTRGPWDVDSDADGVYDGLWVDPNMPLITSREGKLLKVLASYTIESLDSRLDLNATGNLTQTAATGVYAAMTNNSYAVGAGQNLPQGFGYGPAETSLRHLFGPNLASNDTVYGGYLQSRYAGRYYDYGSNVNRSEAVPGTFGNDLRSQLDQRERRNVPAHGQLPALPTGTHGRTSVGLDRLGNPLLLNANSLSLFGTTFDQATDDGYESRLTSGVYRDNPFGFSAWERIYRSNDWDRSTEPLRMDRRNFAYTDAGGIQHPVFEESRYVVSPATRHLRHLPFASHRAVGGGSAAVPALSLFEVVRDMYAYDPPPNVPPGQPLTFQAFQELFPFEFGRGQGLNVNRPLGNGADDDNDGNIDEPEELLKNQLDDDGDGATDEWDERNPLNYRQRSLAFVGNSVGQVNVEEDYTRGNGIAGGNLDPTYEALNTTGPDLLLRRYHFGQQSRQLLARNLYCLGMLILPDELFVGNRTAALTGNDRARAIAQWAVNMVDFRDADSAMTRFPYDPNPFTRPNINSAFWDPGIGNGNVVWGNEQQDVVLTESLFTHDLRVRDTEEDSTGQLTTDANDPDDDYDQLRLPEGSGFFEIKALRTTSAFNDPSVPGVSPSLYGNAGQDKVLNLSALTPPAPGLPELQYPVFRIAISEPHANSAGGAVSPLELQQAANAAQRSTTTYQISRGAPTNGLAWDLTNPTAQPPLQIDRVVLFTPPGAIPLNTTTVPDLPTGLSPAEVAGRVFDNRSGNNILLRGGQYLVVGPRQVTYFGSRDLGPMSSIHRPNHHRIVLESALGTSSNSTGDNGDPYNNWTTVFDANNDRIQNFRAAMAPIVSMIAAQDVPWDPSPGGGSPDLVDQIGLNVSAPYGNTYYTAPTDQLDSSDTMPDPDNNAPGYGNLPGDAYYDFSGNGIGTFLPDQPFDARAGVPLEAWLQKSAADEPLPGTQEDWCTAFLQRLADPERPHHETFNPYITVDWIPIDLTVFSGEDTITGAGNNFRFASRQKSGAVSNVQAGGYFADARRTFLSYGTTELPETPSAANGAYFDRELPVDEDTAAASIRPTADAPGGGGPPNHYATLGYLNSTFGLMGETGGTATIAGYIGAPSDMPASLYWADRQFTNPQELMLVPLSAPGQLMQEFGAPAIGQPSLAYQGPMAVSEFTHLPNFFQSPALRTNQAGPTEFGWTAATMFDFLETPSPWADAEDFVNPADVAFGPSGNALQDAVNEGLAPLRAPYNRISRFVEPGKVNLNDVSEPQVWKGVMWNATTPADRNNVAAVVPYWNELQISRRGYSLGSALGFITNGNPFLHADSPTQFAGVFRSGMSAALRPATRSEPVGGPPTLDALAPPSNPVNATLLRANSPAQTAPLFAAGQTTSTKHPLLETLPATRLQNLTTTRSNVFAVRVTLGFFEYDPTTGIGREYGEDDGTVMRHRGFYVIDRSIPVGYQEGQDLNTDDCILLRRIIE